MKRTTRKLSSRGSIEHLAVESPRHKQDVEQAKQSRHRLEEKGGELYFELPFQSSVTYTFSGLSLGFNRFQGVNSATPTQWNRHLGSEALKRRTYRRPMWDARYDDQRQDVQRRVKHPIETHLQTVPPCLADAMEILCHEGRSILAATLFRDWSLKTADTFRELTGCDVIGEAGHTDVRPHSDIVYSRYSKDQRILVLNGIGVGGPWLTAVDRLLRMGCQETEIQQMWAEDIDKFQKRCAARIRKEPVLDALPVDIRIARQVDDWVDERLVSLGFDVDSLKRAYLERARGEKLDQLRREARDLELRSTLLAKTLKKLQEEEFNRRQQNLSFNQTERKRSEKSVETDEPATKSEPGPSEP
jgi:hypothetical protein